MQNAPIIIKKVKKVSGGGHHGGAWKVAYADFVTAMMAFFLLMWLINATSPEQKKGIADYFAPAAVSESRSGSGGVLGGKSFDSEGARDSGYSSMTMSERAAAPRAGNEDDNNNKSKKRSNSADNAGGSDSVSEAQSKAAAKREADMFNKAAMSLRQAMRDMPELAELSKHLIIDQTPEGMRIQIVDQEGRSMFQAGSVEPYPRTQLLLREIAKVINRLPNRITISGHTDASQVESTTGYTNWELSSDRANAARRIFQSAGVRSNRIYQVSGKASSEPLFPDDPYMSANRRISVVLLREAPVLPPNHTL